MDRMQVNDPHGRAWTVKRQLIRLPRWRGVRKPRYDSKDWANVGSSPSGVEDLAFGTVLEALAWPLVVLLGEFVVAVPLAAARLLLGRWTVVASSGRERHTW